MHPRERIKRMVQNTVPTHHDAYRRFRTCDRKRVYRDFESGWKAVQSIQANGNDHYPDFELRPYTCDYCGKIHVGHSSAPRVTEQRIRSTVKQLPARSSPMTVLAYRN